MQTRQHSRQADGKAIKSMSHMGSLVPFGAEDKKRLELVVKCDSVGSEEALRSLLAGLNTPGVEISIINSGVGSISKSDLLMSLTGNKLVLGLSVGIMPKLESWVKEHDVEVRLYNVIYKLTDDLKEIAKNLIAPEIEERTTGKAKVIAIFKSSPGGIILGCEVLQGSLETGKEFRVITAMGPIYTGRIESLQMERKTIKEAKAGQQIGLKIHNLARAKIGDLVECFERIPPGRSGTWKPSGHILHMEVR